MEHCLRKWDGSKSDCSVSLSCKLGWQRLPATVPVCWDLTSVKRLLTERWLSATGQVLGKLLQDFQQYPIRACSFGWVETFQYLLCSWCCDSDVFHTMVAHPVRTQLALVSEKLWYVWLPFTEGAVELDTEFPCFGFGSQWLDSPKPERRNTWWWPPLLFNVAP